VRQVYLIRYDEQFNRSATQDNYNIILKNEVLEQFGLHLCDQRLAVRNFENHQINKIIFKTKFLTSHKVYSTVIYWLNIV
jgi:hypothetical protein